MTYEITTSHVCPPIPDRSHDWQASVVDYEDDSPKGHGRTELSALVDLINELAGDANPALADAIEHLGKLRIAEAEKDGRDSRYILGLKAAFSDVVGSL